MERKQYRFCKIMSPLHPISCHDHSPIFVRLDSNGIETDQSSNCSKSPVDDEATKNKPRFFKSFGDKKEMSAPRDTSDRLVWDHVVCRLASAIVKEPHDLIYSHKQSLYAKSSNAHAMPGLRIPSSFSPPKPSCDFNTWCQKRQQQYMSQSRQLEHAQSARAPDLPKVCSDDRYFSRGRTNSGKKFGEPVFTPSETLMGKKYIVHKADKCLPAFKLNTGSQQHKDVTEHAFQSNAEKSSAASDCAQEQRESVDNNTMSYADIVKTREANTAASKCAQEMPKVDNVNHVKIESKLLIEDCDAKPSYAKVVCNVKSINTSSEKQEQNSHLANGFYSKLSQSKLDIDKLDGLSKTKRSNMSTIPTPIRRKTIVKKGDTRKPWQQTHQLNSEGIGRKFMPFPKVTMYSKAQTKSINSCDGNKARTYANDSSNKRKTSGNSMKVITRPKCHFDFDNENHSLRIVDKVSWKPKHRYNSMMSQGTQTNISEVNKVAPFVHVASQPKRRRKQSAKKLWKNELLNLRSPSASTKLLESTVSKTFDVAVQCHLSKPESGVQCVERFSVEHVPVIFTFPIVSSLGSCDQQVNENWTEDHSGDDDDDDDDPVIFVNEERDSELNRQHYSNPHLDFILGRDSDTDSDVDENVDDDDGWSDDENLMYHSSPDLTNMYDAAEPSNGHLHRSASARNLARSSAGEVIDDECQPATSQWEKRVHFAEELEHVHHMIVWAYAYQAARKGPWEEFARDRCRFQRRIDCMERTLHPYLQPQHRDIMYKRLYETHVS